MFFLKAEKIIFYLLIFCLPLQLRHIFYQRSSYFNEWQIVFIYATDFLILALLFFWLLRILNEGQVKIEKDWVEICLGFLIFVAIFSIKVASDKFLAVFSILKLLEFSVLFLYLRNNFLTFFKLSTFWIFFIASSFFQALLGMVQFFTQRSLGFSFLHESPLAPNLDGVAKIIISGEKFIRAYGLLPHPNILAAILAVALFGLIWLFIENNVIFWPKQKIKILFWLIAFLVIFSGLFFTFSRGIIIFGSLLIAFWLIWVFLENKTRRKSIFFCFFLLGVSSLMLIICFWPFLAGRYNLSNFLNSQSLSLRSFYNQEAINLFFDKTLSGVGEGNFVTVLAQKNTNLEPWAWQPVHNIYLLIASEIGLLGLLAFLGFLFFTIKSVWHKKTERGISCLFFVTIFLLVVGLFDHFLWDLQQGQLLFWMILGILSSQSLKSPRS